MRTILLCSLLTLGLAVPARAQTSAPAGTAAPHHLVGCYAITDSAGRPAWRHLYFTTPRIRLDAARLAGPWRSPAGLAWTLTRLDAAGLPIDEEGRQRPLYWAVDARSDSIRISIHSGYSGTELTVAASAGTDTLRGRAMEHWDVGPSSNNAGRVILLRIPCVDPARRGAAAGVSPGGDGG
jgi:hypothetical protein